MIRFSSKYLASILLFLLFNSCQDSGSKSNPIIQKFNAEQIYDKNVNNTVTIITAIGQGSGFFIDSNKVITNYHVIEGSTEAVILLNNSAKKYKVNGYLSVDRINDLILLEVDYVNSGFIKIDNSIPKTGSKIFALGSPVGLNKTLSDGLISGMRDLNERKLLQITAPISHGSSGCPILNEKSKLVGVAVGGVSDASNIGFCIPSNYVTALIAFKNNYSTNLSELNKVLSNELAKQSGKTKQNNPQKRNENINSKQDLLETHFLKDFELRISGVDNSISTNGRVHIRKENGIYFLNGSQTDKENKRSAFIKGKIKILNKKQFVFIGSVTLKNPKYGSNCAECTLEKTIFFDWFEGGKECWSSCNGNSSEPFGCIFIGSL